MSGQPERLAAVATAKSLPMTINDRGKNQAQAGRALHAPAEARRAFRDLARAEAAKPLERRPGQQGVVVCRYGTWLPFCSAADYMASLRINTILREQKISRLGDCGCKKHSLRFVVIPVLKCCWQETESEGCYGNIFPISYWIHSCFGVHNYRIQALAEESFCARFEYDITRFCQKSRFGSRY